MVLYESTYNHGIISGNQGVAVHVDYLIARKVLKPYERDVCNDVSFFFMVLKENRAPSIPLDEETHCAGFVL